MLSWEGGDRRLIIASARLQGEAVRILQRWQSVTYYSTRTVHICGAVRILQRRKLKTYDRTNPSTGGRLFIFLQDPGRSSTEGLLRPKMRCRDPHTGVFVILEDGTSGDSARGKHDGSRTSPRCTRCYVLLQLVVDVDDSVEEEVDVTPHPLHLRRNVRHIVP